MRRLKRLYRRQAKHLRWLLRRRLHLLPLMAQQTQRLFLRHHWQPKIRQQPDLFLT